MQTIFFAVANKGLEEQLAEQLINEYTVAGEAVHLDSLVDSIAATKPDVLLLLEGLNGKDNILDVTFKIRKASPNTRIIVIAKERKERSRFISRLVSYGVYDFINTGRVSIADLLELIRAPKTFTDVSHLAVDENKYEEQNGDVILEEEAPEQDESEPEAKSDPEPVPAPKKKPADSKDLSKIGATVKSKIDSVKKKKMQPPLNRKTVVRQKNVAFIGGRAGVGVTSIALNTAVHLAQRGFNTIYIEINDKSPSVGFLYEIMKHDKGIEQALEAVEEGRLADVEKSIIKMSELRKEDKRFKAYPKTLDFLFYTRQDTLLSPPKEYDSNVFRDLYMQLNSALQYDFIIIDVDSDIKNKLSFNSLIFSNAVFHVVTQDAATIAYSRMKAKEISRSTKTKAQSIDIFNRYVADKVIVDKRMLKEWRNGDDFIFVPALERSFINANYEGVPLILFEEIPQFKKAIGRIVDAILDNI